VGFDVKVGGKSGEAAALPFPWAFSKSQIPFARHLGSRPREKSMRTRVLSALVCAFFAFTANASAQTSTGQIIGTVLDPSGAVVAGAKVVIKNEATGISYETSTTTAGTYAVTALPPGSYIVTVTHAGFQTFTSVKNVLNVGADLEVNATLKIGSASQVVEVEASYEKLETTNAMLSGVVSRKEVVELPLNGRNPFNLIILEPGLVQRTNGAAGSGTHVFGSRDRAHNVTIDGIDANESSNPNPQSNHYRLTPDNVQEYRVVTLNATPEFGRNSGANVAVATRSGTNELHGDVFYFHRNTVLNANEFFNKASTPPIGRPVLLLNQFGGDAGGPILKNKTFFFVSYQGNKIRETLPISVALGGIPVVYTQSAKNGLFRYVKGRITFTPTGGSTPITVNQNDRRLVDPTTGNLLPGVPVCASASATNCVATYNMFANDPAGIGEDPLIQALVGGFPLPNNFSTGGDGLNTAAFLWNPPSAFAGPFYLIRVDHKFNDNNNVFVRYLGETYGNTLGDFLNNGPEIFPGFPPLREVFRSGQNLAISYRSVLSPRVVNDFTTGYSRFKFFFSLAESNLKGGPQIPYAQGCFGPNSLSNITTATCNTPHTARAVSAIQFIDNLSYTRSAHTIRTGFNFRFYRHNDSRGVPGGQNIAPTMLIRAGGRSIGTLAIPPAGLSSGDRGRFDQAMVELMGVVSQVNQVYQADLTDDVFTNNLFVLGTRIKQFDSYVQDEWKIRRNLTMTYGVRWELNPPATDCCNRVFVPDSRVDGSQGRVRYKQDDSWWNSSNATAVAPRVSLAWDPWSNGKTVVRAGYGIAFDTISTFQVTAIGGKVPGSVLQCFTRITSTALTGTPASGCPSIPATPNARVAQLISALNPFSLTVPSTAKPSQSFSPVPRAAGTAPSVGAFDPNLKVPAIHEWDLTIQRQLPWGLVAQVGYVGKRGTHLYRAYNINQIFTNQPGFLQSFLIAQQNVFNRCRADGTGCPAGVTGQTPTLLVQLTGSTLGSSSSFLNSSTTRNNLLRNALGALAANIDSSTFTTFSANPAFGPGYFRPNPQFSDILYFDSGGDSIYHGMIVQLGRRFERGLTFNIAYTLSKSIDDMSVDPIGASSGGGLSTTNSRTPTDVRNFRLDRSASDFDNRHVVVANVLYELPLGRGRRWANKAPKWLDNIIGGWSATTIYTYQTGEPFTLNAGTSIINSSNDARTVHNTKQARVNVIGPMIAPGLFDIAGVPGPVLYNVGPLITTIGDPHFDCKNVLRPDGTPTTTFFCIPPPGQNGNTGRDSVRGPGFWNVDLGILKGFTVTERIKLQFRTEFFNVFNHPNFENPRNASDGSPGLTSSLFAQTCCVTSSLASSATVIAVGEPNRVIQFALKVSF